MEVGPPSIVQVMCAMLLNVGFEIHQRGVRIVPNPGMVRTRGLLSQLGKAVLNGSQAKENVGGCGAAVGCARVGVDVGVHNSGEGLMSLIRVHGAGVDVGGVGVHHCGGCVAQDVSDGSPSWV